MWTVRYLPEAEEEYNDLNPREATAVDGAVMKLQALGPQLDFPHSSGVQGAHKLRELRPRRGASPTRPLYRRVGGEFVIAAIGPEADVDRPGFRHACRNAEERLEKLEEE